MKNTFDEHKLWGDPPWHWQAMTLPDGDILPMATIYDANDHYIGMVYHSFAERLCSAVNKMYGSK